jgi:hypothetical protein
MSSSLEDIFELLTHSDPQGDSLAAVKDLLSDTAVWESDAFPNGSVSGPSDIVSALMLFRRQFDDWVVQLAGRPLTDAGGMQQSFEFLVEGTAAPRFLSYVVGGRKLAFRASGLVELNAQGRVDILRTYWNCAVILSQIGVRAHGRPGPVGSPGAQ